MSGGRAVSRGGTRLCGPKTGMPAVVGAHGRAILVQPVLPGECYRGGRNGCSGGSAR